MSDREHELGNRITTHLNRGVLEMDQATQARLHLARTKALQHLPMRPSWELAPAAGPGLRGGVLRHFNARYVLPVTVLLAMVTGMVYWQHSQYIDEPFDIDAKLLAGDLPIDAYLDKGLDSWLKR